MEVVILTVELSTQLVSANREQKQNNKQKRNKGGVRDVSTCTNDAAE